MGWKTRKEGDRFSQDFIDKTLIQRRIVVALLIFDINIVIIMNPRHFA